MAAVSLGDSITLTATYTNGLGEPVTPTTPRITILDPLGATEISLATPTATGTTGEYTYVFPVPPDGELGGWTARWTGTVNAVAVQNDETFTVVAAGGVAVGAGDCFPDIWADEYDMVALYDDVTDVVDAREALETASYLLYMLTGQRFQSVYQCRKDTYRYRRSLYRLKLATTPVDEVLSVVYLDPDTEVETAVSWKNRGGNEIRLRNTQSILSYRTANFVAEDSCWVEDTLLVVEYRVKPNLPAGANRQAMKLGRELYLNMQGLPCKLPDRITSINRQGVSWTVLDPLDFLEKGLTGLGSVDQWISGVNLRGYTQAIDPLIYAERIDTEVLNCGADCEGSGA